MSSVLLLEGKRVIKRQLYTGPFTLREAASFIFDTNGKDSTKRLLTCICTQLH